MERKIMNITKEEIKRLYDINYKVEEEIMKCMLQNGYREITTEDYLKIMAITSAHFVQVIEQMTENAIEFDEIFKSYFENALQYWRENPSTDITPDMINQK